MRTPAKRGVDPDGGAGEGTHAPPRRRREDWRDKHLRACIDCGRVWRRRRRRTCPSCGGERSICLTCDRANPEAVIKARCPPPGEDLRRLVRACGGDWEWARRALQAARGDVARALVAAERRGKAFLPPVEPRSGDSLAGGSGYNPSEPIKTALRAAGGDRSPVVTPSQAPQVVADPDPGPLRGNLRTPCRSCPNRGRRE